jgi:hypothetical protein
MDPLQKRIGFDPRDQLRFAGRDGTHSHVGFSTLRQECEQHEMLQTRRLPSHADIAVGIAGLSRNVGKE